MNSATPRTFLCSRTHLSHRLCSHIAATEAAATAVAAVNTRSSLYGSFPLPATRSEGEEGR